MSKTFSDACHFLVYLAESCYPRTHRLNSCPSLQSSLQSLTTHLGLAYFLLSSSTLLMRSFLLLRSLFLGGLAVRRVMLGLNSLAKALSNGFAYLPPRLSLGLTLATSKIVVLCEKFTIGENCVSKFEYMIVENNCFCRGEGLSV